MQKSDSQRLADLKRQNAALMRQCAASNLQNAKLEQKYSELKQQLYDYAYEVSNKLYYADLEKKCWVGKFSARYPVHPPPDGDTERVSRFLKYANTQPSVRDSEQFKSKDKASTANKTWLEWQPYVQPMFPKALAPL
jgi:hypothetical protein